MLYKRVLLGKLQKQCGIFFMSLPITERAFSAVPTSTVYIPVAAKEISIDREESKQEKAPNPPPFFAIQWDALEKKYSLFPCSSLPKDLLERGDVYAPDKEFITLQKVAENRYFYRKISCKVVPLSPNFSEESSEKRDFFSMSLQKRMYKIVKERLFFTILEKDCIEGTFTYREAFEKGLFLSESRYQEKKTTPFVPFFLIPFPSEEEEIYKEEVFSLRELVSFSSCRLVSQASFADEEMKAKEKDKENTLL